METDTSKIEGMKELLSNEEVARMWARLHTPIVRVDKEVGRNDVCPYCGSGKKFKNCECYATHRAKYEYKK